MKYSKEEIVKKAKRYSDCLESEFQDWVEFEVSNYPQTFDPYFYKSTWELEGEELVQRYQLLEEIFGIN